jgi:hypothetical protein
MWTTLSSLLFLALLSLAHLGGRPEELLAQPLSVFRDGELSLVGYQLFGLLAVIGGLEVAALARRGRTAEAAVTGLATALLVLVAITPTPHPAHEFSAFFLLFVMYAYFGCLLAPAGRLWTLLHLSAPLWLLLLTRFHSYGLWQKSCVVYFLLAANLQHHLPDRQARTRPAGRRYPPLRRHKVYALQPGRAWPRRGGAVA